MANEDNNVRIFPTTIAKYALEQIAEQRQQNLTPFLEESLSNAIEGWKNIGTKVSEDYSKGFYRGIHTAYDLLNLLFPEDKILNSFEKRAL